MTPHDPEALLLAGAEMLRDIFDPLGMSFEVTLVQNSSSGRVAIGRFGSRQRYVELHYRYGLGIVRYRSGQTVLSHEQFMRAIGKEREASFPVVNDATLAGFEALRSDLLRFGQKFLDNQGAAFDDVGREARRNPKPRGFKGLGR